MPVIGRRRPRHLAGLILPMLAILTAAAALICGYVGLRHFIHGNGRYGTSRADLAYYDAQLFVLSSPPIDDGKAFPALLNFARFAAPSVTIYTLFEAGRRVFASELNLLRLRRARGHHVVCGSGAVADAIAGRLIRERKRVVRIAEGAGNLSGARFLVGDPTSAEVLRAAGVTHARALYACTADSSANIAIALAVSSIVTSPSSRLDVHVQVDDPELCLALQARRLGLPTSAALHVNFFSTHELAARTLLRTQPPPVAIDRPARFMVVGASPFGIALIVELAQHWRGRAPIGAPAVEIALVDPNAHEEVDRLRRRYVFLTTTCQFTAYDADIDTLLDGDLPDEAPDRVYLCGEDEQAALRLALTMDQFWRSGPRSVVVRLSQLGLLEQAFHASDRNRLLDDVSGTLFLFDAVRAGSDADLAEDSLVERLGRAVHETYFESRAREGGGSEAVMRPWAELDDAVRAANRAQAADVGRKLRAIGCVLAPSPIWGEPEPLTDSAVERLARMEHQRWLSFMENAGWRYGRQRDDDAKVHPDLVEWSRLPEGSRERDRQAVRQIPAFLADAGFQIVRVGDAYDPTSLVG